MSLFCFCRLRRRHDHEDIKNQRYIENNEKRSKEEKDTSMKEGTILCTPQKNKLGRATPDAGREKASRQSAEKWKRQEDRDLREKRCFNCGREGHIKKECPQYKGATGMKPRYILRHLKQTLSFWSI